MKSNMAVSAKPEPDEYAPYYGKYVSLVSGDDILAVLEKQPPEIAALLSTCTEAKGGFRYAPGKWSVKEVLGHVIDTERIFSYRALRIARNDKTPIEGFEQDDYVKHGSFGRCALTALVVEFESVRQATQSLFRGLDEAAWVRRGVANQNQVSVRAIAFIIAGHERHHAKILQEKYFAQP